MKVILYDMKDRQLVTGLEIARTFNLSFPDRMGIRDGVVYLRSGESYYAYRTKTSTIVRGTSNV